ncbi:hypothetical protein N7532_001777 [Penicillium argentinense]|uniref:Swiss Army Knife RNA repair protein HAD domain-containing protein n=1 Tax=Penicillium argentinense TaxID=1131581 RepID=A0A9W9KMT8_9EURO|nr:uncharacterized protein N7532_001777 [Penicillium argentinense]KAJ5111242.1 hypothetical protein N7532_001777 [Penicillium argentinense]
MSTAQRPPYTLTSLKRWSVTDKQLPAVSQIKTIHVYDFDNTRESSCRLSRKKKLYLLNIAAVFYSPLPNHQLWNGQTIGFLQAEQGFANGGWWHDPNILSATGKGMDIEEARGWQGWWNENIVRLIYSFLLNFLVFANFYQLRLVKLSLEQKDALTVLLTGRREDRFAEIIMRIVASQNLHFDMIGLKPVVGPSGEQFSSTAVFKEKFLEDLILTYDQADDIRVYEDRPKHATGFREYFESMNTLFQTNRSYRKPLNAEVINVLEGTKCLDPTTEVAEVQHMVNLHNHGLRNPGQQTSKKSNALLRIKKSVLYTGYLISKDDQSRLLSEVLNKILPPGLADSRELKCTANNIMVAPRQASKQLLKSIGGLGRKLKWQVTGTANFENAVFAARVRPVLPSAPYHSENSIPLVVLAVRKPKRPVDARLIQNWHPVPAEQALTFETELGFKEILSVEESVRDRGVHSGPWQTGKKRSRQQYDEGATYSGRGQYPGYDTYPQDQFYGHHSSHHHHHHQDDGPRRGAPAWPWPW